MGSRWPPSYCLGCDVAVCTVIGFPHGSHETETKVFEARLACQRGAAELDMVVNVGKVLDRDWPFVEADIRAVVEAAHEHGALAKVIFENEFLPTDDLKIELCRICSQVGTEFVKTSTGFGYVSRAGGGFATIGATDHDLRLMHPRRTRGWPEGQGSSGCATTRTRYAWSACATRIGTSSTAAIIEGQPTGQQAGIASHSDAGY